VTVSLSPSDRLETDDRRYLVLKRPEPRTVLVVAGDARGRAALFTGAALETLRGLSLTAERATPRDLGERPLGGYSFVIVTDAGVLGPAETNALASYVDGGGALLLAFGPRSTSLGTVPITGQPLRSVSAPGGEGYASIGAADRSHPALRGTDELRAAKFFRFAALDPQAGDRVLVSLDDGTPLLLERTHGNGRVMLFMSSLDREWNDLPVQPVFVPLVAGIANHLLGGAGFSTEAELGSTLAVRALGLRGGQIFDPRGEPALGFAGGTGDVVLDQLGFYEVVGGGTTELVAVNF